MTAPTPVVRAVTYERDDHRCVSCGTTTLLQYQHRRATGMGGSQARPTFDDGVTSCASCNPRYEESLQTAALRFGWKVRRWVLHPGRVPVMFAGELAWYRLSKLGGRERITPEEAMRMMHEVYGDAYDQYRGLSGGGMEEVG